jgi:hypothetical protein
MAGEQEKFQSQSDKQRFTIYRVLGILLLTLAALVVVLLGYVQVENAIGRYAAKNAEEKTRALSKRCQTDTGASTGPMWEACMFAHAADN